MRRIPDQRDVAARDDLLQARTTIHRESFPSVLRSRIEQSLKSRMIVLCVALVVSFGFFAQQSSNKLGGRGACELAYLEVLQELALLDLLSPAHSSILRRPRSQAQLKLPIADVSGEDGRFVSVVEDGGIGEVRKDVFDEGDGDEGAETDLPGEGELVGREGLGSDGLYEETTVSRALGVKREGN